MEFEICFFESLQMSSDDIIRELEKGLQQTKPTSWSGLSYRFFEQHPDSVENRVKMEIGEKKYSELEQIQSEIQQFNSKNKLDSDSSEEEVENNNKTLDPLYAKAEEIYHKERTLRDAWEADLQKEYRLKKAWSKHVYSILLPKNELSEKELITQIAKDIAIQAKIIAGKVTQKRVKEVMKDLKPNGFQIPYAWSICYANARLIFNGVRDSE
jgi:hypothetical protein